ncbi:MAG TPA: hypothetical protein VH373_16765 [Jatrophihabitantaceae bacterium]|jgi:hypothetical protein
MIGRRRTRFAALGVLVVIVAAAAVLLAARPWQSAPFRTFTAIGHLDLIGSTDDTDRHPVIAITDDNSCYGARSFGDLDWSAPVTVLDRTGKLAGGSLSEGHLIDGGCRFTFAIKDVPTGRTTYLVKITDREPRAFTMRELQGGVTIRLGA